MRPTLMTLYSSSEDVSETLALPLPASPIPPGSDIIPTLLSTYLLYSLISHTWLVFSNIPSADQPLANLSSSLQLFAEALHNPPTILRWIPYLSGLSPKHLDAMFTRAYTALTKSSSLLPATSPYVVSNAKDIFRIRHYALLLLLHTSPAALTPTMFWDQTIKFTVAFVKAITAPLAKSSPSDDMKHNVTSTISCAFKGILELVEAREDKDVWMNGSAFIGFCEYWIDFAKRVCTNSVMLCWTHTHNPIVVS